MPTASNATQPATDPAPAVPATPPASRGIGAPRPGPTPPQRPAAGDRRSALAQLPAALLQDVAAHLTDLELLRLADAPSMGIRTAIAQPALEARLRHVHRLEDFMLVLNGDPQRGIVGIVHLPAELQSRAFVSLGTCINNLPERERAQAIAAWRRAPYGGPADATLADMRTAAEGGFERLLAREQRVIAPWGPAHVDVARGMSIADAAQRHGFRPTVTNRTVAIPPALAHLPRAGLDHLAARVLQETVTENDHLPTLIERTGFAHPDGYRTLLEMTAAHGVAMAALLRGRPADDIVRGMGLTHRAAVDVVHQVQDRRRVSLGLPIDDLARANDRYPGLGMFDLEIAAVETRGRRLLLQGGNRADVAQLLALQAPQALARLQSLEDRDRQLSPEARHDLAQILPGSEAYERVMAGGNVQDVVHRFGIMTHDAIDALQRLAADQIRRTLHRDDHIPTRIQAAGVTDAALVAELHREAVAGPGSTAILAGAQPDEVARRMGLEEAEDLAMLNALHAEREVAVDMDDHAYAPIGRRATH